MGTCRGDRGYLGPGVSWAPCSLESVTQGVNPYESSGLVTNSHRLTPRVSEYFLHLVHGKQSYTILGVNSNLIECQKVDLPI